MDSGGRLVVNDRQRFEIELRYGETTIVSWAKLLKDSGIPLDHSPLSSPPREMVEIEFLIGQCDLLVAFYHISLSDKGLLWPIHKFQVNRISVGNVAYAKTWYGVPGRLVLDFEKVGRRKGYTHDIISSDGKDDAFDVISSKYSITTFCSSLCLEIEAMKKTMNISSKEVEHNVTYLNDSGGVQSLDAENNIDLGKIQLQSNKVKSESNGKMTTDSTLAGTQDHSGLDEKGRTNLSFPPPASRLGKLNSGGQVNNLGLPINLFINEKEQKLDKDSVQSTDIDVLKDEKNIDRINGKHTIITIESKQLDASAFQRPSDTLQNSSSPVGANSTTLNVLAFGLANIIGGLFVISPDLWRVISELVTLTDKQLHQEDKSRSNCCNIILKKEKDEQKSLTREHCQPIKQTAASEATKNKTIGHARVRSIALTSYTSEQHSLNNGRIELPDLNMPYAVQAAITLPTHIKDESHSIVNKSMLESTILELETMAAESRRLHGDVEDASGTKSRLPRELKKKLENVARLAHSSHGRISDELITHLMSILGHWLKPRTLKRWLRDMVPSEILSCGGDAIRFSQIKKEVIEMINLRNPSKDVLDYETMDLHAAPKAKYSMDHEMEDKICDFYDIYVQGMDEIKSSEIRKFYNQLAALWPNGTMEYGMQFVVPKNAEEPCCKKRFLFGKQRKTTSAAGLDDGNAPALTFLDTAVPGTPELNQNLSAPAKRFSPPSASKFNMLSETT
ncbi:hypothetical protein L1987_69339 [Smallanthus sonchifolius]|uniref:Uncharacterized protein n=1 Tax=Smallanthus sonchifolius TaxID=185202 RepID=A0ACB9B760_9ASTR|nr:hypothetical protein L1987_69339 [Smallanthus sonchifolius]